MDNIILWKLRLLKAVINSKADFTNAVSSVPYKYFILFDREPWFIPILIAVLFFTHVLTRGIRLLVIFSISYELSLYE